MLTVIMQITVCEPLGFSIDLKVTLESVVSVEVPALFKEDRSGYSLSKSEFENTGL